MVSQVSLARPYARALFAEAHAAGETAAWQDRLNACAEALGDESLLPVVRSKVIPREAKLSALSAAIGKEHAWLGYLLGLLVANNRLELMGEIASQFAELVREQEDKQAVTVASPYPLDEASLATIAAQLSRRIGKQLDISAEVDPALIAGIRVSGKGWLIEGNMQAQLAQLSRKLIA